MSGRWIKCPYNRGSPVYWFILIQSVCLHSLKRKMFCSWLVLKVATKSTITFVHLLRKQWSRLDFTLTVSLVIYIMGKMSSILHLKGRASELLYQTSVFQILKLKESNSNKIQFFFSCLGYAGGNMLTLFTPHHLIDAEKVIYLTHLNRSLFN